MNRFICRLLSIFTILVSCSCSALAAAERPNILWITAEDMSPTLGCYGDEFATTPHLDAFARESVRYTRAFASAPVCSPSRSTLITGCYATSLGTMQMRSAFPIPDFMRGFPAVLRRELGYYTSNNVKTDYNTGSSERIIAASWDESGPTAHWRKNPDEKRPFFSIFNLMTTHQSRTMVWPYEKFQAEVQGKLDREGIHDPAEVPLPPYYVDTPVVRRAMARFYDCVSVMDQEVGAIFAQLEADGLAEDTIVFFYSDHGSGMPRHKRALLDSGMHVPLMVRFPEKWQHLAPARPGQTSDRLVSFVDFGPTVLSLAGAAIPAFMQGVPFLGEALGAPRRYVYGHRDRVDEAMDLARSVRDERFLYIRNYRPHLGYNQPTAWPDQGAIRHEFYRLAEEKLMSAAQWHFAGPRRDREELYDCVADPQNLKNLAISAEHGEDLARLRAAHHAQIRESMDLGFVPEVSLWEQTGGTTPWEKARGKTAWPAPLLGSLAWLDSMPGGGELLLLKDRDADLRFWGAVVAASAEALSPDSLQLLARLLDDSSLAVRIQAAEALARHGELEKALPVLIAVTEGADLTAVMYAARAIELLGEEASSAVPAMEALLARAYEIRPPDLSPVVVASGDQDLAMFIGFSAKAFLDKVKVEEGGGWIELFDGKSLEGWTALAKGEVEVVEGEIQILAKGKNLWLMHEKEFEDFELVVELKMPMDSYNSGVGFRCEAVRGKPKGYQCEVTRRESGMLYAIGSGWVWPKGEAEKLRFAEMAGDCFQQEGWNTIRIRAEGDRLRIWVNDTLTTDVKDERFAQGRIAIQHHGKGGLHRFRKVRVKEL